MGILVDADGRVLVGKRPEGKHMAGAWEFPGGKIESGELPADALRRELSEELGIRVEQAERFLRHRHSYPERDVRLDVWWVSRIEGAVRSAEGQELRWVTAGELNEIPLLPADAPIVDAVRLRLGHDESINSR